MIHKYNIAGHRDRHHPETGTIVYLQNDLRPLGAPRFLRPVRREPWIVEAWLNRLCTGGTRGHYANRVARGGHLAIVRSLRSGRRTTVADWMVRMSLDIAGDHRHA